MKKIFFALITLFLISLAYAQDDKDRIKWHYSLGAMVNPDFNINEKLRSVGVHRIEDVSPMVTFGWSAAASNKIDIGIDFGVATTPYGRKNKGYNLVQVPVSLIVHYNFLNREKVALSAGLNGSYTFYDLSIYADDTVIDMNNLEPSENTGYIRMHNQAVHVGPSVAFTFLKHKITPLTLTIGYDFAVTNIKWDSDYASLTNPVKENGGRAYIQLKIPFGTFGRMWPNNEAED